jgi:hypothetical protein
MQMKGYHIRFQHLGRIEDSRVPRILWEYKPKRKETMNTCDGETSFNVFQLNFTNFKMKCNYTFKKSKELNLHFELEEATIF